MKNYTRSKKEKTKNKVPGAADILAGCPFIQINDGRDLIVEGDCRILDYTSERVCISCKKRIITISGRNLEVRMMDRDFFAVCGTILSLNFGE